MRRVILLGGLLPLVFLMLPMQAHAQKFTAYGGYSFFHLQSTPQAANFNGWDSSLTYDFFCRLSASPQISPATMARSTISTAPQFTVISLGQSCGSQRQSRRTFTCCSAGCA